MLRLTVWNLFEPPKSLEKPAVGALDSEKTPPLGLGGASSFSVEFSQFWIAPKREVSAKPFQHGLERIGQDQRVRTTDLLIPNLGAPVSEQLFTFTSTTTGVDGYY
jgi:hypothetical protein